MGQGCRRSTTRLRAVHGWRRRIASRTYRQDRREWWGTRRRKWKGGCRKRGRKEQEPGRGGEPPAVQGRGGAESDAEKRQRRPGGGERRRCIQGRAKSEEDEIRELAPELVRGRGPDESAEDVEERDQTHEARSHRRGQLLLLTAELIESDLRLTEERAAECLLQHGRGRANDADSG